MPFDMKKMVLDDGSMDVYFDPKNYQVNENSAISDFFYSDQFKYGDRVRYKGGMEGKIILGEDTPQDDETGVVVKVRTSMGNITHFGGKIFIFWDSMDRIVPVPHELLENTGEDIDDLELSDNPQSNVITAKKAFDYVSSVDELKKHFVVRGPTSNPQEAELIHKSSQELWSLEQSGAGFRIQRLFDPNGAPIKEFQSKSAASGNKSVKRRKRRKKIIK